MEKNSFACREAQSGTGVKETLEEQIKQSEKLMEV